MDTLLLLAAYSDFSPSALDRLALALPDERRNAALGARNPSARAGSILAYSLLRYGTKRMLGKGEPLDLSIDEGGKPRLKSGALAFSISHSKTAVSVLLTRSFDAVGIDLEEIRRIRSSLIERFASEQELQEIGDDADAVRLWTKKEAAAKRSGIGLRGDLRKIQTSDVKSISLTAHGLRAVLSVSPAAALPDSVLPIFPTERDLFEE